MRYLTEFEKGQIVGARIAGASITKTAVPLRFFKATISRIMTEFKKHRKPSINQSNSGQTSKLTDRDRRALKRNVGWKKNIGLLPPKWLLSWINIWIVQFQPKLFAVSSINPDIKEEPPSGKETSAFLYQHSEEVEVVLISQLKCWSTDQWKQVIFSDESSFSLFLLQGEFMYGGSPGKFTTLTTFFPPWIVDVDHWLFGQPYRGIVLIPSLPCMAGSTARIT